MTKHNMAAGTSLVIYVSASILSYQTFFQRRVVRCFPCSQAANHPRNQVMGVWVGSAAKTDSTRMQQTEHADGRTKRIQEDAGIEVKWAEKEALDVSDKSSRMATNKMSELRRGCCTHCRTVDNPSVSGISNVVYLLLDAALCTSMSTTDCTSSANTFFQRGHAKSGARHSTKTLVSADSGQRPSLPFCWRYFVLITGEKRALPVCNVTNVVFHWVCGWL